MEVMSEDGKGTGSESDAKWWAVGMLFGIVIGIAIGTALDNIGAGIAIGAGLGVSFSIAFREGDRKRRSGGSDDSAEGSGE